MLNWALFSPRNFVVVGIFSAVALALASHLMAGVAPKNEGN